MSSGQNERLMMKRILLKLSGEALAGEKKTGFDEGTVRKVALQIKQLTENNIQVGVVIGGGNFWRGRTSENIDRTKADQIGMLATIMNCIYVSEICRAEGMQTAVLTPFECGTFTKLFSKDRANKYFEKGMVVFFAGGTGHPYFSTDTGVVLRAIEVEAEVILLAKAIDGVYNDCLLYTSNAEEPVSCRLAFRIPGWCSSYTLNGQKGLEESETVTADGETRQVKDGYLIIDRVSVSYTHLDVYKRPAL